MSDEYDADWWAWSFLFDCLPSKPELHREAILKLLEHAPDDRVVSVVGAGPFED
jgi:hypothetical protein